MASNKIGGLWILCDDLDISDALNRGRKTVSLNLNKLSLSGNSSILSIISTSRDEVNFIAVATASKISGDLERKFTFGPFIQIPNPVNVSDLLTALPDQYRKYVGQPVRRVSGIPPTTWRKLISELITLAGLDTRDIRHLYSIIESREKMKKVSLPDVIKFEHDAVAVALEVFQGSKLRQQYLGNSPIDEAAPFIQALQRSGAKIIEDNMISHDLMSFPGVASMSSYLVGAVEIVTDTGKLTLLNSNRTAVEKSIGVDLVYYHHTYNSFTLVQYKKLSGGRNPVYRPDSDRSYATELSRMQAFFANEGGQRADSSQNYRIGNNPFFFKFCDSTKKDHWSRMSPGMYFPLELWEQFIISDEAKGPRDGVYVGYDNAPRWLNNSEFVLLIRNGWIGSNGLLTNKINEIITHELSANKSMIYAIHQEHYVHGEYLRDSKGRFTSPDDNDGI